MNIVRLVFIIFYLALFHNDIMANRTAKGVYESLGKISQETGIDFGIRGMSESQFKSKYFTGPGNLGVLHDKLSKISDETGWDFGQGSKEEWLSSFGFGRDGKSYMVKKSQQAQKKTHRKEANKHSINNNTVNWKVIAKIVMPPCVIIVLYVVIRKFKTEIIMNKKLMFKVILAAFMCLLVLYVAYLYALNGRYIYTRDHAVFDKWEKCFILPRNDGKLLYFKDAEN